MTPFAPGWIERQFERAAKELAQMTEAEKAEAGMNRYAFMDEALQAQIEFARETTRQWPKWKQNILADSSNPTRATPRKPQC